MFCSDLSNKPVCRPVTVKVTDSNNIYPMTAIMSFQITCCGIANLHHHHNAYSHVYTPSMIGREGLQKYTLMSRAYSPHTPTHLLPSVDSVWCVFTQIYSEQCQYSSQRVRLQKIHRRLPRVTFHLKLHPVSDSDKAWQN